MILVTSVERALVLDHSGRPLHIDGNDGISCIVKSTEQECHEGTFVDGWPELEILKAKDIP
jgi:hypothetical protein